VQPGAGAAGEDDAFAGERTFLDHHTINHSLLGQTTSLQS
jgi:hypothetical protein